MSTDQLELRLSAIEASLTEVRQQLSQLSAGPNPISKWWELRSSASEEDIGRMLDEMEPYTKYIRQTGECPPLDWKPGDPIPEPDHWK